MGDKMKKIMKKINSNAGMSLIEMLIGLFLAGLVTASVFEVYINQHKNWVIQDDVTNIQQNGRAAIDELSRQLRMAGHALPAGIKSIEAYDTNPDTIVINYVSNGCDATISDPMPRPSAELKLLGQDISCFYDDQWAYIWDPVAQTGEFFMITEVQGAAYHIQHRTMALSKKYDQGAILLSLSRLKYYIDYSDTLHPNLMLEIPGLGTSVYAENIEDLQFKYTMRNGIVYDTPPIIEDIREIQITVRARSDKPDIDFEENPYRKREYATKVNLRNL